MSLFQLRQTVLLLITATIWGLSFVAQSVGMDHVGPFTFTASRMFLGALVLLPFVLWNRSRLAASNPAEHARRTSPAYMKMLLLGGAACGLCLFGGESLQQFGLVHDTEVGKAGFITALYVVLVPLFGLFFRRKVSGPVWIAVVLSVVSLYLLCIKGGFSLAPGDLLVLVCAVCFAVHILLIDHFTARCDGVKLSCLQFLFAAIWSTILALIFDTIDFHVLWECILPLLYVGVFSCGVGYTLQILAQKDSNPTVVTILLSLESVFAVIAGAIILHQQMSLREYIGCALMFIAVVLAQVQFPAKKAKQLQ